MIHITFGLLKELKTAFVTTCGAVPYAKVLRGLIRAFVSGQIKIEELEL